MANYTWTLYLHTHNMQTRGIASVTVSCPNGTVTCGSKQGSSITFSGSEMKYRAGSTLDWNTNSTGYTITIEDNGATSNTTMTCTTVTGCTFEYWKLTAKDKNGNTVYTGKTDYNKSLTLNAATGTSIYVWPAASQWTLTLDGNSNSSSGTGEIVVTDLYDDYSETYSTSDNVSIPIIGNKADIECTPYDGYEFKHWIVNSSQLTDHQTTNNPYTQWAGPGQDVDIYPVIEEIVVARTWSSKPITLSNTLTSLEYSNSFPLAEYEVTAIKFKCDAEGTVSIDVDSDYDIICYLSISQNVIYDRLDITTGEPNSYEEEFSNQLVYDVTPDKTYILWVRMVDGEDSGAVNVTFVHSPSEYQVISYSETYMYETTSLDLDILPMYTNRIALSFQYSGKTSISFESDCGIIAAWSTSDTLEDNNNFGVTTGYPYGADAKSGTNIELEYDVVRSTTYYLWVRGNPTSTEGSTTVTIIPPSEPYWTYTEYELLDLNDITSIRTELKPYTTPSIVFSCTKNGTATFYGSGGISIEVMGHLSNEAGSKFDKETGAFSNIVAEDLSAGLFSFTFDVVAGTQYRLWASTMYPETSSTTFIMNIVPPGAIQTRGFYIYTSIGWRKAIPYIYTETGWTKFTPCLWTDEYEEPQLGEE